MSYFFEILKISIRPFINGKRFKFFAQFFFGVTTKYLKSNQIQENQVYDIFTVY